jgi:hypothetical protein
MVGPMVCMPVVTRMGMARAMVVRGVIVTGMVMRVAWGWPAWTCRLVRAGAALGMHLFFHIDLLGDNQSAPSYRRKVKAPGRGFICGKSMLPIGLLFPGA